MDRISAPWPLLRREAEVAAVLGAVTDPGLAGVLIVGASGSGKTAIAREAASRLGNSAHLVFVRGSAAMAETPYGALNLLFLELDLPAEAPPLFLLHSVQNALLQAAGERPVVVVVDNVQYLDESSVRALSYLAEAGVVHLMVASDRPGTSPGRFFDLWTKGMLERVDVMPLGLDTMRTLLQDLLETPVSWSAAVELWHVSRGNPRFLQAAVRGDIASGRLALEHDTWVLTEEDGPSRAQRNDPVVGILLALSNDQREALELVAVAGALPLEALLKFAPAATVDELQNAGLCAVGDAAPHPVEVGNGAIGDRLRADLAGNPPASLLHALRELEADGVLPPDSRLRVAEWFLDTGTPLPDDYLLQTARRANDAGNSRLALEALGGLAATDGDTALEYARACLVEGRIRDGHDAVSMVLGEGAGDRADLLEQQVRLVLRSQDDGVGVSELLGRFRRATTDVAEDSAPGRIDPRLLESEVAVYEGRFRDVLSIDAASPPVEGGQDPADDPGERAAHLVLAHSIAGDDATARSVAGRARRLGIPPGHSAGRHALQESMFLADVQAGRLQDALVLTASPALLADAWADAAVAECLEGCLLAQAGRARAALARLVPAIAQLRVRDRRGLLPVAESAAGYARALVGKPVVFRTPARPDPTGEQPASWTDAATMRLFQLLTDSLLRNGDAAARLFGVMADDQRDRGHHGAELLLRMHAVRLGNAAQAPSILVLARSMDTPLAVASNLLASGVIQRDSGVLLAAAESALEWGHLDLAGSAARMSMELHDAEHDPLEFVRAEQILRGTNVPRESAQARRVLTSRERALARMAAGGATNKEIAGAYHLSVRTVEGHVLRAMRKLGISNRKQLSTVFDR
ncbi:helix-turn-helix transcriptional regulator [Arthrobacter sp. NamB2]|uniref:helix-turn-helix transcriptional regulator n=1 Tax=Arthrobacter sp. NamB2 TaxID=2576035 RepID=UPI0016739999|nr:LuxR family transcriptional regulator [Arthrobacter sp. NamB2]